MIFNTFFIIFLSFLPAIFWFWFLIVFQKEIKTVSFKLLAKLFLVGLALAGLAMLIEGEITKFIPLDYLPFLKESPFTINYQGLGFIFVLTFILIAPLEESLKYLFLKREIYKRKEINLSIFGVQLGIILGLGFATFENAFYFFRDPQVFEGVFLSRFFLSTLAHILYGGIMGYYLSLAKFHKLYQKFFLRKGLITAILLHGFFNFSLLTQAFYYTIGITILIFFVLMKWMIDRRDFETIILKGESPTSAPIFSQKQEIDTFLIKKNLSYKEIKMLSFCPKCLAIKKIDQKVCPYCGMRFN